jgi:hypothetical protein
MTKLQDVRAVAQPYLRVVGETRNDVPKVSDKELARVVGSLSDRGTSLLQSQPGDVEDRSARLYELGAILRETGASEEATFAVLQKSNWNKFAGREDESLRLWEAVERTRQNPDTRRRRTRQNTRQNHGAQSIGRLLSRNTQPTKWQVENIWEDRGWGFIAGEPKTYKSTFTTDLAVSIATQEPFLGHFHVTKASPVLIVQEENSESIQHARLARIIRSKGRAGEVHSVNGPIVELTAPDWDCPVYCVDRTRFSFNNEKKRRALEADIKAIQPGLVIFDPLQRMMGDLSIRREDDVTKCLDWLDKVVHSYKTSLLIVHHYNKGREDGPKEGGQRMLGSQALHAWLSCGIYIQRINGNGRLKVTREFRAFDSGSPFELEFDSQDNEDFYNVSVHETPNEKTPTGKRSIELQDIVSEQPGITVAQVSKMLDWDEKRVRQRVKALNLKIVKGKTLSNGSRESSGIYAKS